ncbi:hypothetical protein PHYBLDRAFT_168034 [Phycomyces blakesleeanus NRRL 1555(-)]|uniref:Uncharacterized protein n=1 Tax=Phycomyces blakesleeanus (strain ATCC 8743b / DSM 1359 / FGSC 10004 / NBRC 33097 / NRRL 1555) TaxID=763407 RepID=A0A167MQU1_PHYB8|nr:hypothetical protein PHYBLDRAFT_168034 [Phycomyces blakesleeanus NRRL 1555(-)]OAD73594.1 hypothetical protein PHYBLDRAFT_168034 [Phycomyces blakesleeanus NRRL 1555(-)]|eukprot:XP_018291634.1 hypothetical protein PHYBLDRAFT_168034 [Phycomyces blakesleeanus NRRL 1555(-)]
MWNYEPHLLQDTRNKRGGVDTSLGCLVDEASKEARKQGSKEARKRKVLIKEHSSKSVMTIMPILPTMIIDRKEEGKTAPLNHYGTATVKKTHALVFIKYIQLQQGELDI